MLCCVVLCLYAQAILWTFKANFINADWLIAKKRKSADRGEKIYNFAEHFTEEKNGKVEGKPEENSMETDAQQQQ